MSNRAPGTSTVGISGLAAGAGPRGLFTLDAARRQSQLPQHDQCPVTPCPLVPIATAAVTAAPNLQALCELNALPVTPGT